jgi:hypothetical protein
MDLLAAEQTYGRLLIKVSALGCFLVAGLLLLASLLSQQPSAPEPARPPGTTASTR